MLRFPRWSLLALSAGFAAILISACGGGGGDGSGAPSLTLVSGSVVKGPVSSSTVCAYKTVPTGKGEQLKCATTTGNGSYSLELSYLGDVVIEASGGTYTDEATGVVKALTDSMQLVIASQGGAVTGMVTPLTTVAYSLSTQLSGGVTSANFNAAATTVATQFQLGTGTHIATTLPTLGADANPYGKALQGVSQYVANGGSFSGFLAWTDPVAIEAGYTSAYAAINGVTVTFNFDAATNTMVIGGTGMGGGTVTCAIGVSGSATLNGQTYPINAKYCINGLQSTDMCSASSNTSINQILTDQYGTSGTFNVNFTYGTDCTGADMTIELTS